jgi:hypothetical protein
MVWDCLEGDPSASFDAGGWAVGLQKFSSQIPFLENFGGYQLTKDPNNCFPTIATDLDTSNAWFWIV